MGHSVLLSLKVGLHLGHNLLVDYLKIGLTIDILLTAKWIGDNIIATQSDPDSHFLSAYLLS